MKHELVQFENGTYSLRSPSSGEAMHSRIGAWEEAQQIYVKGTGLSQRLKKSRADAPVVIYDLGLGIAANALAAWHCSRDSGGSLSIVSFESDLDGLRLALAESRAHPGRFSFLDSHSETVESFLREGRFSAPGFFWELMEGDFLSVMHEEGWRKFPKADLIFFDFYSPDTDSALWSEEVFARLRSQAKPDAVLATYSCRKLVLKNLLLAGFVVGEGGSTGAKKTTTLATPTWPNPHPVPAFHALDGSWLERLKQSPLPVTDQEWARLIQLESLAHPHGRNRVVE